MERKPYQPPQTSMERHLVELVEHARNGTDNRSGFAQKIESAQEHAFWLENECDRLRKEVRTLEDEMAVGLPKVSMDWKDTDVRQSRYVWFRTIDWIVQPIGYRVMLRSEQSQADEKTWSRIRKWTFRSLVREMRKEYERCVPAQLPVRETAD